MAVKQHITLDQGTTFSYELVAKYSNGAAVGDLSGYTGQAQMRRAPSSSISKDFTVSVANSGNVVISMTATETANVESGRWLYDVEITSGSEVIRIVEGIITVTPEITR